jgi:hypothetical protein
MTCVKNATKRETFTTLSMRSFPLPNQDHVLSLDDAEETLIFTMPFATDAILGSLAFDTNAPHAQITIFVKNVSKRVEFTNLMIIFSKPSPDP